jgi:hypothetical protein
MLYDRTPIDMNYTTIYISYMSLEKFHSENGERLVFCERKKTQQQNTLVSTLRTRRSKEQYSTDSTNYQNISHRLGRDRLY